MTPSTLSVVIITFNRREQLRRALESVLAQTRPPDRIHVIDNASSDGTESYVRERFPQVDYVRLERNLGVAGGRNVGLQRNSCDVIFMLDDDAVIARETDFELAMQHMAEEPEIGVLWGTLRPGGDHVDEAVLSLYPSATLKHHRYTFTFSGGLAFLRQTAIAQVGMYDGSFFRQGEEDDLAYRLHRHGWRVMQCPDIGIIHEADFDRHVSGMVYSYGFRHAVVTQWRYLPFSHAVLMTAATILNNLRIALRHRWLGAYFGSLLRLACWVPVTVVRDRKPITVRLARRLNYLKANEVTRYPLAHETGILGFIGRRFRSS